MCSTVRSLRASQRLCECLARAKTNRDMFGHLYARVLGYVSACWLTVARVWESLCACVRVCVVTPQSPWPCAVARRQSAIRKSSLQREPDHFQRHLYLHGVQFADLSRIKGRHTRRWGREGREVGRQDDPSTPHTNSHIHLIQICPSPAPENSHFFRFFPSYFSCHPVLHTCRKLNVRPLPSSPSPSTHGAWLHTLVVTQLSLHLR